MCPPCRHIETAPGHSTEPIDRPDQSLQHGARRNLDSIFLVPSLIWVSWDQLEEQVSQPSPPSQVQNLLFQGSSSCMPAVGNFHGPTSSDFQSSPEAPGRIPMLGVSIPDRSSPAANNLQSTSGVQSPDSDPMDIPMAPTKAKSTVRKRIPKRLDPRKLEKIPEKYRGCIEGEYWKCVLCGKRCDRWHNYYRHLDIHKPPEERDQYFCPVCGESFSKPWDRKVHLDRQHQRYYLNGELLPEGAPKPPPKTERRKRES